jgi:hypothetical protein
VTIKCVTLALAVAAIAGPVTGELRAQEINASPAPSSLTDASRPDETWYRPCFYNARALNQLSNTVIAAEMAVLLGAVESAGCRAVGRVPGIDQYAGWGYMLEELQYPERVSREKVEAVWEASRKAAAEAEARERLGHVWVPTIGNGHGSDEALVGRTLVFRVAPAPTPATYNGIPIVDRNRSWERFETKDGQRVWRVVEPSDSYGRRPGVRARNGAEERFRSSGADRSIQRQEGMRPAIRSLPTLPARSSASSGSTSGSTSSSGTARRNPRSGKKVEQ